MKRKHKVEVCHHNMKRALEIIVTICILQPSLRGVLIGASKWSYSGKRGPRNWHTLFPYACSGRFQSPIDIHPEETIYNPNLKDFTIWYDPPRNGSTMSVLNNGHTIQVVTSGDFFITNAGLPFVYKTAQFHFHWGHAKHHGSEHLIDGRTYPMEMHIVNFNVDLYDDITEALTESQGLAVLAVLFEETEKDNQELEDIISVMDRVKNPEAGESIKIRPLSLRSLLPHDISRFYRYNGSLTTPGCFESVVWTIFTCPKRISHRQMHKFRSMLQMPVSNHQKRSSHHTPIVTNRKIRRRERSAIEVLNELGLTSEQKTQLHLRMLNKSHVSGNGRSKIQEENHKVDRKLSIIEYNITLPHVRHSKQSIETNIDRNQTQVLQHTLVNNFRPIKPLNNRIIHRSFRLSNYVQSEHSQKNINRENSKQIKKYNIYHCLNPKNLWVQDIYVNRNDKITYVIHKEANNELLNSYQMTNTDNILRVNSAVFIYVIFILAKNNC